MAPGRERGGGVQRTGTGAAAGASSWEGRGKRLPDILGVQAFCHPMAPSVPTGTVPEPAADGGVHLLATSGLLWLPPSAGWGQGRAMQLSASGARGGLRLRLGLFSPAPGSPGAVGRWEAAEAAVDGGGA